MKLKIGELAKAADCPVGTIRFYEKKGLLTQPERTDSNYRLYGSGDIERLRFILHCRRHGIKLADIRRLLAIKNNGGNCKAVHELLDRHLLEVEKQLESLAALKMELETLRKPGSCHDPDHCSILENLSIADGCHYCSDPRLKTENGLKPLTPKTEISR